MQRGALAFPLWSVGLSSVERWPFLHKGRYFSIYGSYDRKDVEQYDIFPRHYDLDSFPLMIFVGVRRSGKSFLLFQKMRQLLADGKGWDEMLYLYQRTNWPYKYPIL